MKKITTKLLSVIISAFYIVGMIGYFPYMPVYAASNEEVIYSFMKNELGFNTAVASAALANIYSESGFNPHSYCIDTDGAPSYGICQWHLGRYERLQSYCSSNGYDYTSLDGQLRYLQYEFGTSYNTQYNMLKSFPNTSQGAYDAGYYWAQKFEVCASKYWNGRGNLAQNTYYPKYKDTPDPTITYDPEGYLDSAEGGYGTVTLTGWALDRDTPDEACEIHIYMDGPSGQGGTCIATGIMADQPSPDVASIIGVGGNHRFNATLNLDVTGNHTFYAYAINRGGGNHNPELYNYFTTYIYEKTNSVISNVYISSVTPSGFTVNVAVSDESKVGRIAVPVWTTHKAADHGNYESGQDDLLYNWENLSLAKKIGTNTYVFDVSTLDHNDESGEYNIDVYAYSPDGSQIDRWCLETNHRTYANVPSNKIITGASVTNLTPSGYTLQIQVADDSIIDKIAVPVWTTHVAKETGSYEPGQDDLISGWQNCSVAKHTDKNLYVYEVSTVDHNDEAGEYNNDIYAYDATGNIIDRWCLETKHRTYANVPSDKVITDVCVENVNPFGYDVVINVANDSVVEKIAVPVWTSHVAKETSAYEPGQDDLISGWGSKCIAEKIDSNKYVYHVSTSDHNNEDGEYCNDIYVYGDSGKLLDRWCLETHHRTYSNVPQLISGDINLDGECNVSDVVLLQKWLLAVPDTHLACWQAADLCEDNRLDVFDLCMMKRMLIYG